MKYYISGIRHVNKYSLHPDVHCFATQESPFYRMSAPDWYIPKPPVLVWVYNSAITGHPCRVTTLVLSHSLELNYAEDILKFGGRCTFLARHNKKIKLRAYPRRSLSSIVAETRHDISLGKYQNY